MKRSILIVDDMEINREILAEAFRDKFDIIEAENGKQAIDFIESKNSDIAAVLLDMVMPEADGIDVLNSMNENGSIIHIPVFIITADNNDEQLMKAYTLGAADVIKKPYILAFLKCRIENIIELYEHRNDLEDVVNEQVRKLSKFNKSMVEALASLVEFRDCESGEHVKRICSLTEILMNKVSNLYPEYRLPKAEIDKIVGASVLHDVGKIAIPDNILNKPGKLTPEEFEIMKQHTSRGADILQKMPHISDDNMYNYSYDIARHHHERWDGNGYPDHLKGDQTSIWAQVVSVVDVYDALVSPRVYKKAFDHDTAVSMIMGGECGTFNPKVLTAFRLSLEKIRKKHLELMENDRTIASGIANLLIVDDSEIDRSILKNILEPDFQTLEAENGYEALEMLEDANSPKIDGVLLDITMPVIDGFTVLKILRAKHPDLPVILMTAEATKENVERGIKYKIAGFLSKPFNPYTVITSLHSVYNVSKDSDEEPDEPKETLVPDDDIEASMAYFAQLKNLYGNYLANNHTTDEPYKRVSDLLAIMLEKYAAQSQKTDLDHEHIQIISKAAYFYDIGKMGIPDKDCREKSDERNIVFEDHTKLGACLVRLNKDRACGLFVDACAEICMHHHERYDGFGYPHKLEGSEISYFTAMCSLCIEFDRIFISRGDYNERQFELVIKALEVDSGKFDHDYIDLMNSCGGEIIAYYNLLNKE